MILGFAEYEHQSRKLAQALETSCHIIDVHYFPDGECKLTLPPKLPQDVIICRSLDRPNDKLIELLLAAETARELGANKLTLVAPYLCYMRQDTAFHPGESVSQRSIGHFLSCLFDVLITVDPHLHRIHHLQTVVPDTQVITLSASGLMADFLRSKELTPLLLGPDAESQQWVEAIAKPIELNFGVCSKVRSGDREVTISLPERALTSRYIVLVDDVISSGQTLAVAARQCLAAGAERVDVLVSHPLFAEQGMQLIKQAGVSEIWSTDSITHETNIIPLAGLLSKQLS